MKKILGKIGLTDIKEEEPRKEIYEGKDYLILPCVTYQNVRDAIDELNYQSKGDKEKKSVHLTISGKDWKVDVVICFIIEDNWLKMYSYSDFKNSDIHLGEGNLSLSGLDLYKKINEYNRKTRFGKAYLEDNVVFLERNNFADAPISEGEKRHYIPISKDYLSKNLDVFIDVSAHFFNTYLFEDKQDLS